MAVPTAVWVGLVHPEITPPSNFHQLRDTTSADRLRVNDKSIELTVTRDQWRITVSKAIGANLNALRHEANAKERWSILRNDFREIAGNVGLDLVHYTPVWLFVDQQLKPFSIGPVRFFPRENWPDEVSQRFGSDPEWREPLALLWAGQQLSDTNEHGFIPLSFKASLNQSAS